MSKKEISSKKAEKSVRVIVVIMLLNFFDVHNVTRFLFRAVYNKQDEVRSMVIYADVLVFLNAVTDYFLLLLTARILRERRHEWRIIIGAIIAGFTSLYLFAPQLPFIADFAVRVLCCGLIVFVTFGYGRFRRFIRLNLCYLGVTVLYSGLIAVFWLLIKPNGMVIRQSIVYFDISAVQMLLFSAVAYMIINIGGLVLRRILPDCKRCRVVLCNSGSTVEMIALVDTGNSLCDIYGNRPVILTDRRTAEGIFDRLDERAPLYLPVQTVSGNSLLRAYPCEKAVIGTAKKNGVLVAVAERPFHDDYRAIVNPNDTKE